MDDRSAEGFSIGVLAARTGLTPAVLRTWDNRFGFPAGGRSATGHRRYSDDDVDQVRRVIEVRDTGVPLRLAIDSVTQHAGRGPVDSVHAALAGEFPELRPTRLGRLPLLAVSHAVEDEALFGWVPGPEKQAEFAQDVSIAFMLALERLSPLERAAFLLHDVFDMDYDEIARHLDRSEASCRQLISRARKNVKADYARREVAKEEADRLVHAFMDAVRSQDVSALARLLSDDAVMMADGGGKVSAVPQPLHGGAQIARIFIGFAQMPTSQGWRLVPTHVNGLPGVLIVDDSNDGRLVQTIALAPAAEAGQVGAVYIQRNPDKLGGIRMRVTSGEADPS